MEVIEAEATILTVPIEDIMTYYVVIDGVAADTIRIAAMTGQWLEGKRGFGSVRVTATIGEMSWQTSLFPHKASGGWFLPVKAAVRKAERLVEDQSVSIIIAL